MIENVMRLIAAFEGAKASSEVWHPYLDFIKGRGFGWCTYTYEFVPLRVQLEEKANDFELRKNDYAGKTWITSVSDEAKDEYLSNQYDRVDPVVEHVKTSLIPLSLGREYLHPAMPGFAEAEALFLRAEAYGVYTGYCVPLRHPSRRGHGSATLHCALKKDDYEANLHKYGASVHLATLYMHAYFQPLERRERAQNMGINGKPYQVLERLSAGLSNKQIADELDISEPTVSFHMNRLKERLNASNTREIVATASLVGILDD